MYNGKFPKFDPGLLEIPVESGAGEVRCTWRLMQNFTSERDFQSLKEKDWINVFLEAIYTLWYGTLEMFIKSKDILIKDKIYIYACKKLWELKDSKIFINPQILLSTAFLTGYFNDEETFSKTLEKFKKTIQKFNLKCSLFSQFYNGACTRKQFDTTYLKKRNSSLASNIKIPSSISTHYETNEFCTQCGMYIPEEFIFAMFDRSLKTIKIDCPNKNCNGRFEPKFNCVGLKVKGQSDNRKSVRLLSPVRLVKKLNDFLFENFEKEIFNKKKSGFLYWNILFYFNFMGLPAFYVEKDMSREVFNFSMVYLDHYFVSQDFKKRFGDRTRIPTTKSNIKDSESSFGNLSVGSGEGKGVKFSSKKDFIKRLAGYDDRLKKVVRKSTLKALFPYCEHLRNFEFKYNMFQRYSDFVQNFVEEEDNGVIEEDMMKGVNFEGGFNKIME